MRGFLIAAAAGMMVAIFQPAAYAAAKYKGKKADEAIAGMKSKPVHKSAVGKTNEAALTGMVEWIQKQ